MRLLLALNINQSQQTSGSSRRPKSHEINSRDPALLRRLQMHPSPFGPNERLLVSSVVGGEAGEEFGDGGVEGGGDAGEDVEGWEASASFDF